MLIKYCFCNGRRVGGRRLGQLILVYPGQYGPLRQEMIMQILTIISDPTVCCCKDVAAAHNILNDWEHLGSEMSCRLLRKSNGSLKTAEELPGSDQWMLSQPGKGLLTVLRRP
jgi:hypothetical protein